MQEITNEFAMSDWIENPELWNRELFLSSVKKYLLQKNSVIDDLDFHLLMMLISQIEIYISGIKDIKQNGSVVYFNNGVTLGPNPQIGITDKALNRILQIAKELELSPRSRNGFQSNLAANNEFRKFLAGPCG